MAEYSRTPLSKKLGIRPGMRMRLINEPGEYLQWLGELPQGVKLLGRMAPKLDFMHGFVTTRGALERLMGQARRYLARDGMLWVSWPKKSSGIASGIMENDVRKAGLVAGLVDVKICAVDNTWSGLRFVYRVKDR